MMLRNALEPSDALFCNQPYPWEESRQEVNSCRAALVSLRSGQKSFIASIKMS